MYKRLLKVCNNDAIQSKNEIRWMKEEILKRRTSDLSVVPPFDPSTLTRKELHKLNHWISQRQGTQTFLDLNIIVRQPVLIPRWETEEWTDNLIKTIDPKLPLKVLELCSGTGCISLALASSLPLVSIDAIDVSKSAFVLSRLNQRRLEIPTSKLKFHLVDLYDTERMRSFTSYDLVISNPPYISPAEYQQLDKSVKDFEDSRALIANDEFGTKFYEKICSLEHLYKRGSKLVFEIGETQGERVQQIMKSHGFLNAAVQKDLSGSDRVVSGEKSR
ncbi:S-adenosyl-L-methionine-dependent methyltransferase [Globomyces pollinis-pini]|nr:S-adenosyl-L-methionine-dependent methyltransferase [Globomyces pollinis-pini]